MGAPGEAFLCRRGHLYHWIDDDLFWEDGLWKESRRARVEGCPCREKRVLVLCHYGGSPNDCLCLPDEVDQKGVKLTGAETFRVPIPDAVDKDGKSIKAYCHVGLSLYDVSNVIHDFKRYTK